MKQFLIAAVLYAVAHSNAFALASGSVVFDPSNFAKNTITASQAVHQVAEQIRANMLLYEQYRTLARTSNPMEAARIYDAAGVSGAQEMNQQIQNHAQAARSLSDLNAALKAQDASLHTRVQMAQDSNMTLAQYVDSLKHNAQQGDDRAKKILADDRASLQRVALSYQQADKWTRDIPKNESMLGAMQVMNAQMSTLVTQNADLQSYLIKQNIEKTMEEQRAKAPEMDKGARAARTDSVVRNDYTTNRQRLKKLLDPSQGSSSRPVGTTGGEGR